MCLLSRSNFPNPGNGHSCPKGFGSCRRSVGRTHAFRRVALRRVVPCAAPEPLGGPGAPACACCARRAGVGGARGARLLPAHARIPRGARDPRVRASLHPLRAPRGAPRGRTKTTNPQARMVRARGARREGAGHSYGPWLSPTPTKISRRARHRGKHLLRAPHGAPGRVHQTPPAPLGARLSARREPRGLRTTARPVAHTRARGANFLTVYTEEGLVGKLVNTSPPPIQKEASWGS